MTADKRSVRVPLLLTPDEAQEIDDWRYTNRLPNRSDAIRELIRRSLDASKAKSG